MTNSSDQKSREVRCKMGYERSYEMGVVDAHNRTKNERAGKTNFLSDMFGDSGYHPGRADDKKAYEEGWKAGRRR